MSTERDGQSLGLQIKMAAKAAAGLGLAYLLALLTGYIIQYPISQAAGLLFSIWLYLLL